MTKLSAVGTENLVGFEVLSGAYKEESEINSANKSSPSSLIFISPVSKSIEWQMGDLSAVYFYFTRQKC